MSRPMLLVFLLLILIITSQFEWRQQLVSDMDTNPGESQKQQQISKREEVVKEKMYDWDTEDTILNTNHKSKKKCPSTTQCSLQELKGTLHGFGQSLVEEIKLLMDKAIERARTLKEIILSQEKNIQRLNELVKSLREQLQQCQSSNETLNSTVSSLTENVIELERQQILED